MMPSMRPPTWLTELRKEVPELRLRDYLSLALWTVSPWIVVGYFVYEWLIANADLGRAWLLIFGAAYGSVRLFSRLMQFNVLVGRGMLPLLGRRQGGAKEREHEPE
jgi:hypothetical protein